MMILLAIGLTCAASYEPSFSLRRNKTRDLYESIQDLGEGTWALLHRSWLYQNTSWQQGWQGKKSHNYILLLIEHTNLSIYWFKLCYLFEFSYILCIYPVQNKYLSTRNRLWIDYAFKG